MDVLEIMKPAMEQFLRLLPRLMAPEANVTEILQSPDFMKALEPIMALFEGFDMGSLVEQIMKIAEKMAEIIPRLMAPDADFEQILMDVDFDGLFMPILGALGPMMGMDMMGWLKIPWLFELEY